MSFPKHIWEQLKSITVDDLIAALNKDGWKQDPGPGSIRIYTKGENPFRRRVSIHYHPGRTYGAGLLKGLLADIGWDESEMLELKLLKK